MNKFVRVGNSVKRFFFYGGLLGVLGIAQQAGAQSALLVNQSFTVPSSNTDAQNDAIFPPTGWSSTPAANTASPSTTGWRYSTTSNYGPGLKSCALTINNGSILSLPSISSARTMNYRIAVDPGDSTNPTAIVVEYSYDATPTTYVPIDTLVRSDFSGSNRTTTTVWNLISYNLTGITGGSYKIRFRDARTSVGGAGGSNANARFIDSVQVSQNVSVDTAFFRTRADGNFSDYTTWQYFNGDAWVNSATNVIPLTTNSTIIKNTTTLDTTFVVGTGRIMIDTTTGSSLTIAPGKALRTNTTGTGTINFGSRLITVQSNAAGTGKIGRSTSGSITATNVTVERYIPAKATRKWSFISSPFGAQTIRNGWQQQIFITGTGTGGTPCGAGTGNGGATDKYNSNGFDDTQNDPSSMDAYANTVASNGTHWTMVSGTGITLTPGLGYRVNVRGDRTDANACANQINYSPFSPAPAAGAVTLKSNGTYSSAVTTSLNTYSSTAYTLLGNPYPNELSFATFQAANNGIANKAWIYASNAANTSDVYSTWNAGTITNGQYLPAANIQGSAPTYTDIVISSGGAFIVERANSGTSVSFAEGHKTLSTVIADGNGVFSKTTLLPWTDIVRARLQTPTDTVTDLDNIYVRFSDESGVSNTTYGTLDAYSFNPATATIASLKGTGRMAIQTRVKSYTTDTVSLYVGYTAGSYRLKFDEFDNFTNASSIYLLDYFQNTVTDVKANNSYNFNITSNSLSQGGNRFALAFGFVTTPLSIKFINVAAKSQDKGASVNFTVANEKDIQTYSVERSDDGAAFYTSSTVKATNAGSYTVSDNKELKSNSTLFRVKATDLNGNIAYSAVVKLNQGAGTTTLNVYPNPVAADINISLSGAVSGNYALKVYDVKGSVVMQQSGAAAQSLKVPASQLQSGIYMVKLTLDNGEVIVKRFVKK